MVTYTGAAQRDFDQCQRTKLNSAALPVLCRKDVCIPSWSKLKQNVSSKSGQFEDLSEEHKPIEEDHELEDDLWEEPNVEDSQLEQGPKKIRRRFYRSDDYWRRRAEGAPPLGPLHDDVDLPQVVRLKSSRSLEPDDDDNVEPDRKRQVTVTDDVEKYSYEPTSPAKSPRPSLDDAEIGQDAQSGVQSEALPETPESQPPITSEDETAVNDPMPPAEPEPRDVQPHEVPVPMDDGDELIVEHEENNPVPGKHDVMEVSIEVRPEDITEQQLCLWEVIEDCFVVQQPAKQRRVEVSFRKLNEEDKKRFEVAMKKEWQSWIDNKVTSICKSRGIPRERVIRARWVLVWKNHQTQMIGQKPPKLD